MAKLYTVTITHAKATGGVPVKLPVKRTALEVAALVVRYPGGIKTDPPFVAEPEPDPFPAVKVLTMSGRDLYHEAITSLAKLYRVCEAKGDLGLARRAEEATRVLLGAQRHLELTLASDRPPPDDVGTTTIRGVGR